MTFFRMLVAFLASLAPLALFGCGGAGGAGPRAGGNDTTLAVPEYVWDSQVFKTLADPGPARIQPVFHRELNGAADETIELLDRRKSGASCLEYQVNVRVEAKTQQWAVYRVREILPSGAESVYFVTDPRGRAYEGASRGSFEPDDRSNRAYDKSLVRTETKVLFLNDFPVKCEWQVVRGDARDWIDAGSPEAADRVVLSPPPTFLREGQIATTALVLCNQQLLQLQAAGDPRFTALLRLSPEGWRDGEGGPSAVRVLCARTPISQARIGSALDAANGLPSTGVPPTP